MLTIKELFRNSAVYGGQEVEVNGWVRTIRDSKSLGFIELNDGTFFQEPADRL